MEQSPFNLPLYSKFAELISNTQPDHQQLLAEIKMLQRSAVWEDCVKEDSDCHEDGHRHIIEFEQVQQYVDELINQSFSPNSTLLQKTETAVFNELIELNLQTNHLQEQILKEIELKDKLSRQLEKLRANPEEILSDNLKRQKNLLFLQTDFDRIKDQIKQLSIRIQSIHLLQDNIDDKIESAKTKNQQLRLKKQSLTEQLQKRQELVQKMKMLTGQSRRTSEEINKQKEKEKDEEEKKMAAKIMKMLEERLELEEQIEVEASQKEQFVHLLVSFKEKYKEVELKNKELKQKMKKKGYTLPPSASP